MPGSIALVGSGEYLPAMAALEQDLLDRGIEQGKKARYIQIPTAAGEESPERLQYWKELGAVQAERLEVESEFLPILTREDAFNMDYAAIIENSALMYMSGGNPHYLAEVLVGTPVWSAILENWLSGASLAGCSAGAMVMSSEIPHFRFSKRESTPGLGLLPSIRVIPHFDKFFRWIPESAAKVIMQVQEGTVLIGIDELTALVRNFDNPYWQVHGRAKVHVLKGAPTSQFSHGDQVTLPL
jgi:cyanophycinase-like exopeptidase